MQEQQVKQQREISLQEAADLIANIPDNRFLLRGEPGIGKSSVLNLLESHPLLPAEEYDFVYVDCASLDLGDTAAPIPNREERILEYFPNGTFKLHTDKKVVLCLDEFSKGAEPVRNMLHPLLEENKPRMADKFLKKGSIVFLTGNLSTDGVGDNLKAHSLQRVTECEIRKPSAETWLPWATANNIAPEIRSWVYAHPDCLASYRDPGQESNPYPYNPRKPNQSCVSPRTLSRSSNIVHVRKRLTQNAVHVALAGTAGAAFADSFRTYLQFSDQLPTREAIRTDPKGCRVPAESGAQGILVYAFIDTLAKDNIDAYMTYAERLNPDWMACLVLSIAKDKNKQAIAFSNARFRDWCANNQDLF
jgi:hypothetical protein